jgi:hypothetical protein
MAANNRKRISETRKEIISQWQRSSISSWRNNGGGVTWRQCCERNVSSMALKNESSIGISETRKPKASKAKLENSNQA